MERIYMDGQAAKHLQAYIEYDNIVGGYDGGKMMNDQEFEEFKNKLFFAKLYFA